MGDINTKFHPSSDIGVNFDENIDVAIKFHPNSDISINIPSDIAASVYVAEYQTVYDSFTNKPTNPDDTRQNAWVEADVADGLWDTKKDVQYNFAIHTNANGEAQTNWINPGTYDCTLVNAPAFVAFEGFTGDGISAYIDTNWNPAVGVNYIQDSASAVIYIRNNIAISRNVMGCATGFSNLNTLAIMPRHAANLYFVRINTNNLADFGAGSTDSRGMFIANRTASNVHDLYRNKGQVINGTDVSNGLTDKDLVFLAFNANDVIVNHTAHQVSGGSMGAGYTQTNINNDTDNFETYMDSYGNGIIP